MSGGGHPSDPSRPDPPADERSRARTGSDRADGPDLRRADEIFDRALDLATEARDRYLRDACAGDAALEAVVRRLLAACDDPDAGQVLHTGGAQAGAFAAELERGAASAAASLVGRDIGPYHIVSELGRGGMAVVYLAERRGEDFEQWVALKILQTGIPSAEMLRRFQLERQILAQITHPGIAGLLDAGATDRGEPYLIMEYVDGQPIDVYCDERRLTVRERLQLFVRVAEVVAYAHRNLVVHRDIKPSNILVTSDGHVKLLDFGIAKLIGDESGVTRSVMRAMTPAFASPEQVAGRPVTTATDVYQLGMLLYTLLTSRWPYGGTEGDELSLLRAITDKPPLRASTVIASGRSHHAVPGAPAVSTVELEGTRRVPLRRLRRELTGDLDTILGMALRKEADRRYPSVDQFARDIERFLAGQTVSARPDTVAYRARKFLQRNAAAAALATAAVLAIVGLTVHYTSRLEHERDIARREAAKATETAAFLRELFSVSAPTRARGEAVTARDLLDAGAGRIADELSDQPELRASLETTIGEVYGELAMYEEASAVLTDAVATLRAQPGSDHLALADALFALGRMSERQRDNPRAEAAFAEALAIREAELGPRAGPTAMARNWLGMALYRDSRFAAAESLMAGALGDLETAYGPVSLEAGNCLNHLALVKREQRDYESAIGYFERALAVLDATAPEGSPIPAAVRVNYAVAVRYTGDLILAERLLDESLPLLAKVYGETHPNIGVVLTNLANLNRERGHLDEAEQQQREAMAVWSESLGPDHVQISWCWNNLGLIRLERGDHAGAAAHFARAVALVDSTLGPDDPENAVPVKNLAEMKLALDDPAAAAALYERALKIYVATYGPDHSYLAKPLRGLAEAQHRLGHHVAAAATLARAVAVGRDKELLAEKVEPLLERARCLRESGRQDEASAVVDTAEALARGDAADLIARARADLGRR